MNRHNVIMDRDDTTSGTLLTKFLLSYDQISSESNRTKSNMRRSDIVMYMTHSKLYKIIGVAVVPPYSCSSCLLHMERPQIYFFLLPLAFVTLILYLKILFVLWQKRDKNGTLFYKLIRTQACKFRASIPFFWIAGGIRYLLCTCLLCVRSSYGMTMRLHSFYDSFPQDWPAMYNFLFGLNDTILVQLFYAHSYTCINGQVG